MNDGIKWVQDKEIVLKKLKKAGTKAATSLQKPLFATVSGVLSTKPNLIKYADSELGFDLITTKSFQRFPNVGNREPIICQPEKGCFGNSVGLRNPGMEIGYAQLKKLRDSYNMNGLLNVSLSASSAQDFIILIKQFEDIADCIELNFSCPHAAAGFGASIGCNLNIAEEYVKKIKEEVPSCKALLFIKLTPNVSNIGAIAKAVINAGADGITAINTVGPELYIEPHSKMPILNNKLGGKGGKSGAWIFERALECIAEIRYAVGDNIPIIGMGGVSTGKQAALMFKAGADAVGIGSAFGCVHQNNWKQYLACIAADTSAHLQGKTSGTASSFIIEKTRMDYEPKKIISIKKESSNVMILTLEGSVPNFEAGQFVFLYLPGVGEKPFSLASSEPLRFIIKKRGEFTSALFNMKEGSTVYMRGLYGAPAATPKTENAFLIAGGTGIAVLPALASKLHAQGNHIWTYIGTSEQKENGKLNEIELELAKYSTYKSVADNGIPARVLAIFKEDLLKGCILPVNSSASNICSPEDNAAAYIVGPSAFMQKAAEILLQAGFKHEKIFVSLEMNTMCGVGLCGECSCGNKLTCQQGTFVSFCEWKDSLIENSGITD